MTEFMSSLDYKEILLSILPQYLSNQDEQWLWEDVELVITSDRHAYRQAARERINLRDCFGAYGASLRSHDSGKE